jgi:hypothetical protein
MQALNSFHTCMSIPTGSHAVIARIFDESAFQKAGIIIASFLAAEP